MPTEICALFEMSRGVWTLTAVCASPLLLVEVECRVSCLVVGGIVCVGWALVDSTRPAVLAQARPLMWTVGRALHITVLLALLQHCCCTLGGSCHRVGGRAGRGGRVAALQGLECNQVRCRLCNARALDGWSWRRCSLVHVDGVRTMDTSDQISRLLFSLRHNTTVLHVRRRQQAAALHLLFLCCRACPIRFALR